MHSENKKELVFSKHPDGFGFYCAGCREDSPRFIFRERQRKWECYHPSIVGYAKVSTRKSAIDILEILNQNSMPGREIVMPFRGTPLKPERRKYLRREKS
jgi:hypothetical protein